MLISPKYLTAMTIYNCSEISIHDHTHSKAKINFFFLWINTRILSWNYGFQKYETSILSVYISAGLL